MNFTNLTPEQFAKVSAKIGREVEDWLRDQTVEPHYSVEKVAELLMLTPRQIERYIELGNTTNGREGIHPVCKLSFKTMRIPSSSVNRFLQRCTIATAAPSTEEVPA